jgi:hypothetical protein
VSGGRFVLAPEPALERRAFRQNLVASLPRPAVIPALAGMTAQKDVMRQRRGDLHAARAFYSSLLKD